MCSRDGSELQGSSWSKSTWEMWRDLRFSGDTIVHVHRRPNDE